ncbi:MAG: TIGR03668 family PPOX class F420-dependent oxidoreductase [Armatimonadota bacterium]
MTIQHPPRAIPRAVATFVSRQRIAHLATAARSGKPHVVPLCFALAGANLYSVVDRKPKRTAPGRLRRVRNILHNPHVTVVVDTYSEDWSRLGFVILEGLARILDAGPEHSSALRLLRRKYPQYRSMDLGDRPVIAVKVQRTVHWGNLLTRPRVEIKKHSTRRES